MLNKICGFLINLFVSDCKMENFPGGCSSSGSIDRLDCRDRAEFDATYCPKTRGDGFSIEECNAKCLDIDNCVLFQRGLSSGNGVCWFYDTPDPNGSNGGADEGWECGVKQCSSGIQTLLIPIISGYCR